MFPAGICAFGGVIMYENIWHLGTFCEDGTYTLPIGHKINLGSNILTIIPYAVSSLVDITFKYTIGMSRQKKGVINICDRNVQQRKQRPVFVTSNFNHSSENIPNFIYEENLMHIFYYWFHIYYLRDMFCPVYPIKNKMMGTASIKTLYLTDKCNDKFILRSANTSCDKRYLINCAGVVSSHNIVVTTKLPNEQYLGIPDYNAVGRSA